MEWASIKAYKLVEFIWDTGKMIYNMGKGLRNGRMEVSTRDNFSTEKRMELANRFGQMDQYIMENGFII